MPRRKQADAKLFALYGRTALQSEVLFLHQYPYNPFLHISNDTIDVHSNWRYAFTELVRRYSPLDAGVDRTGWYVVFDDDLQGHSNMATCRRELDGRTKDRKTIHWSQETWQTILNLGQSTERGRPAERTRLDDDLTDASMDLSDDESQLSLRSVELDNGLEDTSINLSDNESQWSPKPVELVNDLEDESEDIGRILTANMTEHILASSHNPMWKDAGILYLGQPQAIFPNTTAIFSYHTTVFSLGISISHAF